MVSSFPINSSVRRISSSFNSLSRLFLCNSISFILFSISLIRSSPLFFFSLLFLNFSFKTCISCSLFPLLAVCFVNWNNSFFIIVNLVLISSFSLLISSFSSFTFFISFRSKFTSFSLRCSWVWYSLSLFFVISLISLLMLSISSDFS